MKKILLTQGKCAIVDDSVYKELNEYMWYALYDKGPKSFYAVRMDGVSNIRMHRIIMPESEGLVVDHINGDTLDNRVDNLRVCTISQNSMNRPMNSGSTSGYKGVSWVKPRTTNSTGKWKAQIGFNRDTYSLGSFTCRHEAARVYNFAARMYHGEFAYTNNILNNITIE